MHLARSLNPTGSPLISPGNRRVTVFRSFTDAEPLWRRATETCACYGFQSFEWQSAVQVTIGNSRGVKPYIVHVTDEVGDTLLLLPLGTINRLGLSILVFLGNHVTDYNAPVINPIFAANCTPEDFLSLWKTVLQCLPRIDLVWLRRMPAHIEGVANPFLYLDRVKVSDSAWMTCLPTTFSDFRRTRSSKLFADTARQRRRLAEIGSVTFEIVRAKSEVLETVDIMLRQKQRRLHETNAQPLLPDDCMFYREMGAWDFQTGRAHVSRLRVNEQVVATHVGLVFGKRFYWLMPGYESGPFKRFSCGKVLLEDVVRWCIDSGMETFDLTVGDESYKQSWADVTMPIYETSVSCTWKGAAALAAWRLHHTRSESASGGAAQAT